MNVGRKLTGLFCFAFGSVAAIAQTVPPSQGGPGTIDPNTISAHVVFDYMLAPNTDEIHRPVALVTDNVAGRILGSVLQRAGRDAYGTPQFNPPRSVITKFTAAGAVQWARERQITTVSDQNGTTFYEAFSDNQTPVAISQYEGQSAVRVVALAVDAQDNVFVGFDEYYVIPPPNAAYVGSKINLIVKFDANGNFLWRRATTTESDSGMADTSELRKLQVAPDGGVVALINNHQSNDNRLQQTVLVKFASDGTKLTFNHYGVGNDGSIQFESELLTVTQDSNGNIFLLTTESPDPYSNPTPDQIFNVIRKLDPSGNLITRKDVPVYPGYTASSTNYPLDGWVDAAADAGGNLYVAGSHFRGRTGGFNSSDEGESNQLVLKFDPSLAQLWRVLGPQPKRTFSDENQAGSGANVLRLSATGVTVGGNVTNSGVAANEYSDFWEVTRYALDDGHLIWHRLYQAPAADPNQGFTDTLAAMDVDGAGNVYAAGSVSVAGGGLSPALIKYSERGDLQFVKLFPSQYPTQFANFQPSTLSVPAATNRPTFYGSDLSVATPKEVFAIDFDNPAVVAAVGSLANISTRVRVGGNDNVLIGGTIVTGPSGSTKKVLVRAIGPSLTQAGVSGALPDTTLEVRDSAGHVYTNDNWKVADPGQPNQQSEIDATGVAPTSELESALIATIPTGGATAIVRGKGGATGVGLVEVYDLDAGAATQLANISTRGVVETDANVMIGGIIALSPNPDRVFVRAIGPSLIDSGVPNALQDPILELRDVNGNLVVSNDDWQTRDGSGVSQQAEIEETTIPPTDPRESAARVILDPGNYTVIVRGKGGSTGVALVEAYRLQ